MLHSHSHQENSFDFFASFLQNVLNGDDRYKGLITPFILDAKSLASGTKNFFEINRNGFEIIVYLAQRDKDFFSSLDPEHLSTQDYQRILNLITTQRELTVA